MDDDMRFNVLLDRMRHRLFIFKRWANLQAYWSNWDRLSRQTLIIFYEHCKCMLILAVKCTYPQPLLLSLFPIQLHVSFSSDGLCVYSS